MGPIERLLFATGAGISRIHFLQMPQGNLHDDRDVEEILKLAVREAGLSDEDALRQRLNAAGQELGLSPKQLAAAEEKYMAQKAHQAELAEYKAEAKKDFWEHFLGYLVVNGGLVGLDVFWGDGVMSWSRWPILIWGAFVAIHALETFAQRTSFFQAEFGKWRQKRLRRFRRRQQRQDSLLHEPNSTQPADEQAQET